MIKTDLIDQNMNDMTHSITKSRYEIKHIYFKKYKFLILSIHSFCG